LNFIQDIAKPNISKRRSHSDDVKYHLITLTFVRLRSYTK